MYIIILIRRSFKILVAIIIRFDFKMFQYDVVNVLINTPLNKTIYIRMPVGYKEKGKILHLYKALYGLRKLSLLW